MAHHQANIHIEDNDTVSYSIVGTGITMDGEPVEPFATLRFSNDKGEEATLFFPTNPIAVLRLAFEMLDAIQGIRSWAIKASTDAAISIATDDLASDINA